MNKDLLLQIKEYVEKTVVTLEGEYGYGRSFEEVKADQEESKLYIPDFYYTIVEMLDNE